MIVTRWVDNFKNQNYLDAELIQTYTSPYTIQGKKQNYLEKGILNVSNPNILKNILKEKRFSPKSEAHVSSELAHARTRFT